MYKNQLNEQKREEIINIMLQTLSDFGFDQTLAQLEKESGNKLESEQIQQFKQLILLGNFKETLKLIPSFTEDIQEIQLAKFLIYKNIYYENLLQNQIKESLEILQNELKDNCADVQQLYQLASLIIIGNNDQLKKAIQFESLQQLRRQTLNDILTICKSNEKIKPNLIYKLLEQSKQYQYQNCLYHNNINNDGSYLHQHQCFCDPIPTQNIQTLKQHNNEVWIIKFSNSGKYLASAAKKSTIIIYKFQSETFQFSQHNVIQQAHNKQIHCLEFNPSEIILISGASTGKIKLWDIDQNQLIKCLNFHHEKICSIIWLSDTNFITSGIDNFMIQWDLINESHTKYKCNRSIDTLIDSQKSKLFSICSGINKIIIYDILEKKEIIQLEEKDTIVSASISNNDQFLIVNTGFILPEIHIWCLKEFRIIQRLEGHFQENFMLKCSFGGESNMLVSCGSESFLLFIQDGKINIWHQNIQKPLEQFQGHDGSVNSVIFHPVYQYLMVSCSDDHTIKSWIPQKYLKQFEKIQQQQQNLKNIDQENNQDIQKEDIIDVDQIEEEEQELQNSYNSENSQEEDDDEFQIESID